MASLYLESFDICREELPEDSYLYDVPAVASLDSMAFRRNVTLFCGENGTGKSTVLSALAEAWGLNPGGGTKNYRVEEENRSELSYAVRLKKGKLPDFSGFFRADRFVSMVEKAESDYSVVPDDFFYGDGLIREQSHGEGFFSFLNCLQRRGLYFLDEPDSALSVQNQLALMYQILQLVKKGSQFIIVTHSPILLGFPGAEIFRFGEDAVLPCEYEETESYALTLAFLKNRESFFRRFK